MNTRISICLAVLVFAFLSCSSPGNAQNDLPGELRAAGYDVSIWLDSSHLSDSTRLISRLEANLRGVKYLWKNQVGEEPLFCISNASGFSQKFPVSALGENEQYLHRLAAVIDTVSREQTFNRDGRYCFDESIFIAAEENLLFRVDRFTGRTITYRLTDSLVRLCMSKRYHNDDMYQLTRYMVATRHVADERAFYYPQVYKDTLIVLCRMTTCDIQPGTGDTNIKKTQYLLKFKNDRLVSIYSLPGGYFHKNYYLEYKNCQYESQGVTFYVRQWPMTDTDMHVFARFVPDEQGTLVFRNFLPSRFPEEYFRYNLHYVMGDVIFQYPYYIFPGSDKVYNLLTGSYSDVTSLYLGSVKKGVDNFYVLLDRSVYDFKIDPSGIFHISFLDDGYVQILTYDPVRHVTLNRTRLWPTVSGKSVPYFDKWDHNYIFYWEKNFLIRRRV